MYSTIGHANYEYKDVRLGDLRERLMKENNLNPLKILQGYVKKSELDTSKYLTYVNPLTEKDMQAVQDIKKMYQDELAASPATLETVFLTRRSRKTSGKLLTRSKRLTILISRLKRL